MAEPSNPPSCCTKQRCGRKSISAEKKADLRATYNVEVNRGRGCAFLGRLIDTETVANAHGKRKFTYRYFIPNGEIQVEVCQGAFKELFDVTEAIVRSARSRTELAEREIQVKKEPVNDEDVVFVKRVHCTCTIGHAIDFTAKEGKAREQFNNITDWSSYFLKDSTLEMLFEEDFTSINALKTISEQDLTFFNQHGTIRRGQINLLREFVKCLNCEQHKPIITSAAKKRCTPHRASGLEEFTSPSLQIQSVIQQVPSISVSSNVQGPQMSQKEPFTEETSQVATIQERRRDGGSWGTFDIHTSSNQALSSKASSNVPPESPSTSSYYIPTFQYRADLQSTERSNHNHHLIRTASMLSVNVSKSCPPTPIKKAGTCSTVVDDHLGDSKRRESAIRLSSTRDGSADQTRIKLSPMPVVRPDPSPLKRKMVYYIKETPPKMLKDINNMIKIKTNDRIQMSLLNKFDEALENQAKSSCLVETSVPLPPPKRCHSYTSPDA